MISYRKSHGHIMVEEAYAQSKMAYGSSWKLPRGCIPSDIDACFDNAGRVLLCELSKKEATWDQLKRGQRMLYEALVRAGNGKIRAVLARHSVPTEQQIDSRNDVVSYQVMWLDARTLRVDDLVVGGWPEYVERFYGMHGGREADPAS